MVSPFRDGKRPSDKASLSVIRLPTLESGRVEKIRKEIARQEGVSSVTVDLLRGVAVVEYDPDEIELEEIRTLVRLQSFDQ